MSCLAACGGGAGLLSGDQANTLNGQLDALSAAVSSHNCGAATADSQNLGNAVASLPQTVNSNLRADLNQGASTITDLASRFCRTTTTPTTPTATTATASTATTSPTTTQSTTTTTTTHPSPPPTTSTSNQTTSPSGGGNGQGGGQGNGGGSSGGAGVGGGQ